MTLIVVIVALTRHSLIFGTPTVMIVNALNELGWWKTLKNTFVSHYIDLRDKELKYIEF